ASACRARRALISSRPTAATMSAMSERTPLAAPTFELACRVRLRPEADLTNAQHQRRRVAPSAACGCQATRRMQSQHLADLRKQALEALQFIRFECRGRQRRQHG